MDKCTFSGGPEADLGKTEYEKYGSNRLAEGKLPLCAEMCSTKSLLAGDGGIIAQIFKERVIKRGYSSGAWGWQTAYRETIISDWRSVCPPGCYPTCLRSAGRYTARVRGSSCRVGAWLRIAICSPALAQQSVNPTRCIGQGARAPQGAQEGPRPRLHIPDTKSYVIHSL